MWELLMFLYFDRHDVGFWDRTGFYVALLAGIALVCLAPSDVLALLSLLLPVGAIIWAISLELRR